MAKDRCGARMIVKKPRKVANREWPPEPEEGFDDLHLDRVEHPSGNFGPAIVAAFFSLARHFWAG